MEGQLRSDHMGCRLSILGIRIPETNNLQTILRNQSLICR